MSADLLPDSNTEPTPMPLVGVIFVTMNAAAYINRALDAVYKQTYPADLMPTILVDNASVDPTVAVVREQYPWVKVLAQSKNRGFAHGNNIGMRSIYADYYALVNADAAIAPNWVSVMVDAMEADPTIGVAGSKILYRYTRVIQHAGGMVLDNARTLHIGDGEIDRGQYNERRDVDYVMGAAFMIRGNVARKLGYLPRIFWPAYYEEADFCAQVRRAKKRVVYIPEAVASHDDKKHPTDVNLPKAFLRYYHKNRYLYAMRNIRNPEDQRKFRNAERAFRCNYANDEAMLMFLRNRKFRNWRFMLRHPWIIWA